MLLIVLSNICILVRIFSLEHETHIIAEQLQIDEVEIEYID